MTKQRYWSSAAALMLVIPNSSSVTPECAVHWPCRAGWNWPCGYGPGGVVHFGAVLPFLEESLCHDLERGPRASHVTGELRCLERGGVKLASSCLPGAFLKLCCENLARLYHVVSILGFTGALFRSSLRWSNRDCEAASKPHMCHMYQRQQSREVAHPTLPELVSFPPAGARRPQLGLYSWVFSAER